VVTLNRIADQPDQPGLEVGDAAHVVEHREIGDIVIQGVDGEIAPPGIVLDAAVDVVAEDAAIGRAFHAGRRPPRRHRRRRESGDFDDFLAKLDVRQPKAAADQPAVAEQGWICSGRASVAISKSLGSRPSSKSRTPPPTRQAR
jgi:hypothetical protein